MESGLNLDPVYLINQCASLTLNQHSLSQFMDLLISLKGKGTEAAGAEAPEEPEASGDPGTAREAT